MASVKLYSHWIDGELGARLVERLGFHPAEIDSLNRWRARLLPRLAELKGRDLQCWCAPNAPCHADVLLSIAARGADFDRHAA